VPLHTHTILAPTSRRYGYLTALAAAGTLAIAGAVTVVADGQPTPQVRAIAAPMATRYLDIEANKAASMRALGRHMADTRAGAGVSRYEDLESNKARSQSNRLR
jgi:hypothetical protein